MRILNITSSSIKWHSLAWLKKMVCWLDTSANSILRKKTYKVRSIHCIELLTRWYNLVLMSTSKIKQPKVFVIVLWQKCTRSLKLPLIDNTYITIIFLQEQFFLNNVVNILNWNKFSTTITSKQSLKGKYKASASKRFRWLYSVRFIVYKCIKSL